MGFLSVIFISLGLFGFFSMDSANAIEKLPFRVSAQKLFKGLQNPSSPILSPYGDKISFLAKKTELIKAYPAHQVYISSFARSGWTIPKRLLKKDSLHYYTQADFSLDGSFVLASLTTRGFKKRVYLYEQDSSGEYELVKKFRPKEMGLDKNPDFLKHARFSPNQEWMTFYIRGEESKRGIYLYNFLNNQLTHLGAMDEKHPTWTQDGKTILFHYQTGGNSVVNEGEKETSQIGYYKLDLSGENIVSFKRVLLNNGPLKVDSDNYFKHPTLYEKYNLLFFHGKTKESKKSRLYVRRFKQGSKIYRVMIEDLFTRELSLSKHPSSSFYGEGLVFIGKRKKKYGKKYNKKAVFMLEDEEIAKINEYLTQENE